MECYSSEKTEVLLRATALLPIILKTEIRSKTVDFNLEEIGLEDDFSKFIKDTLFEFKNAYISSKKDSSKAVSDEIHLSKVRIDDEIQVYKNEWDIKFSKISRHLEKILEYKPGSTITSNSSEWEKKLITTSEQTVSTSSQTSAEQETSAIQTSTQASGEPAQKVELTSNQASTEPEKKLVSTSSPTQGEQEQSPIQTSNQESGEPELKVEPTSSQGSAESEKKKAESEKKQAETDRSAISNCFFECKSILVYMVTRKIHQSIFDADDTIRKLSTSELRKSSNDVLTTIQEQLDKNELTLKPVFDYTKLLQENNTKMLQTYEQHADVFNHTEWDYELLPVKLTQFILTEVDRMNFTLNVVLKYENILLNSEHDLDSLIDKDWARNKIISWKARDYYDDSKSDYPRTMELFADNAEQGRQKFYRELHAGMAWNSEEFGVLFSKIAHFEKFLGIIQGKNCNRIRHDNSIVYG